MNKKSPTVEIALGIAMAVLGIVFLVQGFRLAGVSRFVFILFGIIDLLFAFRSIRYYLIHNKKG